MNTLRKQLLEFGIELPPTVPVEAIGQLFAVAPARATLGVVAASAMAFLHAERGHNPKVNDIYDALLYCATCLNVGYAESHPRTPVGKLIGTMLQTFGPALAARTLDGLSARAVTTPAASTEPSKN